MKLEYVLCNFHTSTTCMGFLLLSFALVLPEDLQSPNVCLFKHETPFYCRKRLERRNSARFPVPRLAHSSHPELCQDTFRKQGNVFLHRITDIHMTISEKYVFILQKKMKFCMHACVPRLALHSSQAELCFSAPAESSHVAKSHPNTQFDTAHYQRRT